MVERKLVESDSTLAGDLLRGVDSIARFIGESRRRTYYLLEGKAIPSGKQGACWIASKSALRAHYNQLTSGQAA